MDLTDLIPISFLFRRREAHKSYYSVTWKLSKYLKPSDLLGERPYPEYYYQRNVDHQIIGALRDHRNILIIGPSLAGKSRTIFETLKRSKEPFDILIPICREINSDTFVLPLRARFWRKGVVILDDLQRFVEQRGFERLVREVFNRGYIIVASSRTGKSFEIVKGKFAEQGLDLNSLFDECQIEIPPIDEATAKKVALNTERDWNRIQFNGTIGSIFMKLSEMETRFISAPDEEKVILRVIKKLYTCGIFYDRGIFPIDRIRRMVPDNDTVWNRSLEELQLKEFIKVSKTSIIIEPAYIEEIITPFPETELLDLCRELAEMFNNDPKVLLRIANRLKDYGKDDLQITDFMKEAIILYRKVLNQYSSVINSDDYAMTLVDLGNAFRILAEVENMAGNCRLAIEAYNEALTIFTVDRFPTDYAMTQVNLGTVYGVLAEVDSTVENCRLAIDAQKEALTIYKINGFLMQNAATQVNLGISYGILAEVENKADNCRLAINSYKDALAIYTIDRFPRDYAMTQHNLGIAYGIFAKVENKAENCRLAIEAYNEALKIYTVVRLPMDYAMTKNNLGDAYGILAMVENKVENCRQAIEAYNEALKIYTVDRFPMLYAMAQGNLGNAYWTLADVENKVGNCRLAIDANNEALKFYTIDKYPMKYAKAQSNLGNMYRTLAEVERTSENSNLAIIACKEALRIYTIDGFSMQYANAQNNLGIAYGTLAKVEKTPENCKLAIDAYREALKIYTIEKFPMDYAMTQNNQGLTYATLAWVEDKALNCLRARESFKEALKIFTIEEFPIQYDLIRKSIEIVSTICRKSEL
jgi:tetratricopeptide (TPR) repeat protein